jgi:hypothetical protein
MSRNPKKRRASPSEENPGIQIRVSPESPIVDCDGELTARPASPGKDELTHSEEQRSTLQQRLTLLQKQLMELDKDRLTKMDEDPLFEVKALGVEIAYHKCAIENLEDGSGKEDSQGRIAFHKSELAALENKLEKLEHKLEIARCKRDIERLNSQLMSGLASSDACVTILIKQLENEIANLEQLKAQAPPKRCSYINPERVVRVHSNFARKLPGEYFSLPHNIIEGSGLAKKGAVRNKLLYKRGECEKEVQFILDEVIKRGYFGFIQGQPGTGKSTTAFYVACYLRKQMDIIWVHCAEDLCVVTIRGDELRQSSVRYEDFDVETMSENLGPKIFLIIDGLCANNKTSRKFLGHAAVWNKRDQANRRSLRISSNGSMDRFKDHAKEYKFMGVGSWSLDEYNKAVENDAFWSVAEYAFPISPTTERVPLDERLRLVKEKFAYAGTCARFMFDYSVEEVKVEIAGIMSQIPENCDEKRWHAVMSANNRHQLISVSFDPEKHSVEMTGFVSEYVARRVGMVCSSASIRDQMIQSYFRNNPAARGWPFEAYFFARAREEQHLVVTLRDEPKSRKANLTWSTRESIRERVIDFQPCQLSSVPLDCWLVPDTRSQGGYDAVMIVSETRTIRFVQVTVGQSHDLKMRYFADLVEGLRGKDIIIENAELFFLIPDNGRASFFNKGTVYEPTRFTKLFPSWKGSDVKSKVEIVMIPFETAR